MKTSTLGGGYTSEYSNRRSYQTCTGISLLYEAINDLPVGNSTRNDDYLYKMRANVTHKIEHGFRVWPSQYSLSAIEAADAEASEYRMWDWGLQDKVEAIPEVDERITLAAIPTEGSFATALTATWLTLLYAITF